MKRTMLVASFFISLLAISGLAFADCKCADKMVSDNYAVRAPSRLLHGIINAGLGWTKLFSEPVYSVNHEGQDFVDGFYDGLGQAIYYTALGVWDIATFWFPGEGGKEIAVKKCVLMRDTA